MAKNFVRFDEDRVTHEPVVHLNGRYTMHDLVNLLSELEKRTGKMPAGQRTGTIDITPIVSSENGMPMVELQSPALDKPMQLNHAQAFELGHALIEVTATSISDAMVFGFITVDLGIPSEEAAKMLHAFRGYRERRLSADGGEPDSPNDPPKSI